MASVYSPPPLVVNLTSNVFFFFFFFFFLLCHQMPCSASLNPNQHNATTVSFPASSASASASSAAADSGLLAEEDGGRYLDGELVVAHFVEETCWYNDLVLGPLLPHRLRSKIPRPLQSWLRSYIAGLLVYFGSASLWCLYIYGWKSHVYFPAGGDTMPSKEAILLQIWVSMKAMPIYVMLPVFSEYMVERGWSQCYSSIHEVGLFRHVISTFLYLALVEFGIYWVHRLLHDCKALYKWLHATHHIYNKENTLSPFAGLAFHPLDGLAQALPHAIFIYLVPTQLLTHELLLFVEGIWTTNIHDCLHGKVWPIMGAGYHTIHHTTYRHNYGHYTIWMDWMFGTLLDPCEPKKSKSL